MGINLSNGLVKKFGKKVSRLFGGSDEEAHLALDLVEPGTDQDIKESIKEKKTKTLPEGITSRMLYRDIARIAWPSFVELTLTQLASMVDMMMVGQLGAYAIAGVGRLSPYTGVKRKIN